MRLHAAKRRLPALAKYGLKYGGGFVGTLYPQINKLFTKSKNSHIIRRELS